MHHMHYNMDGEPISVEQLYYMLDDFEENFRVARTEYDGIEVSTVLLLVNHNYMGDGPPLIFETMVFGGNCHHWQRRYSTREEAEAGHVEVCQKVFAWVGENA